MKTIIRYLIQALLVVINCAIAKNYPAALSWSLIFTGIGIYEWGHWDGHNEAVKAIKVEVEKRVDAIMAKLKSS